MSRATEEPQLADEELERLEASIDELRSAEFDDLADRFEAVAERAREGPDG